MKMHLSLALLTRHSGPPSSKVGMGNNHRNPTNPATWVPTLYFAEGAPFFIVSLIAGIFYKRLGFPNDIIALYTSWLLLPWSLKPIWSPLLEIFRTKKFLWFCLSSQAGQAWFSSTSPCPCRVISATRSCCSRCLRSLPRHMTLPPTGFTSRVYRSRSSRPSPVGKGGSLTLRDFFPKGL